MESIFRMKGQTNFVFYFLIFISIMVFIHFVVLNCRYLLDCLCRTDNNGITFVVLLVPNVT